MSAMVAAMLLKNTIILKVDFAAVNMISAQMKIAQVVEIINVSVSPKYLSFNSFLLPPIQCSSVPFLLSALACQISGLQQ